MKVLIVAAPLEGRSGVYRTTYDLVAEARLRGLPWSGLIGMRPSAPTAAIQTHPHVAEVLIDAHGFDGVRQICGQLEQSDAFSDADVVVTLITQSDLAAARLAERTGKRWVAFLRGMPWPVKGEQGLVKRVVQRAMESRALRRADAVWATTEVLAQEAGLESRATIVPAGIPMLPRQHFGELPEDARAVWAGRLAMDKRPGLFVEAATAAGVPSTIFGAGPLEPTVRAAAGSGVTLRGWVPPDELWTHAAMFVGTSYREAFGRSAAEAALLGVPAIIGERYGAAPLLVRDAELRGALVQRTDDPLRWGQAMRELWENTDLRRKASDHLRANAESLSIAASVDRMVQELGRLER